MKHTLSFMLLLCMLFAFSSPAYAAKKKKAEPEAPPAIIPSYQMSAGKVNAVNINKRTIEITKDDGTGSLLLLLDKELRVVDNTTKAIVPLQAIKTGLQVYAWHPNRFYAGNPLSTEALAIIVNVSTEQPMTMFFEIESVTKSGGTYQYYNQPQDIVLSVSSALPVKYFNANRSTNAGALKPGSRILVWVDGIADSLPLQAVAKSIMLFESAYDGYFLMEKGYININGYMLATPSFTNDEGGVMIPALEALDRIGLKYKYGKTEGTLSVIKQNTVFAQFTAGQNTYALNGKAVETQAPIIKDNIYYIDINALLSLVNYKVVIK